jgi:hypothetical protein
MLWGNKDVKDANTGTLQIYANGYCVGTSTLFDTEARTGEYVITNSTTPTKYQITRISSNTVMQVAAATLGGAVGAVAASNTFVFQNAPAFVAAAEVGASAADVYGIDTTEIAVANGSLISIPVNFMGSGYTANAAVTVGGNGTANATANATGKISAINVVLPGNSYSSPPSVTIAAPAARSFNANTSVASNGFIAFATNVLQNNDIATYIAPSGNTALLELANNTAYYIVGSNSTGVYLATTLGGTALTLTKGITGELHTLTGETATAYAPVISGLANKITHAGWVRRVVGTGGRAGRIQFETLVASGSISGDAEDTVAKDA